MTVRSGWAICRSWKTSCTEDIPMIRGTICKTPACIWCSSGTIRTWSSRLLHKWAKMSGTFWLQSGVHLSKWFKSLDGHDLEDKFELKESLIPTAGLYRNLNEAVKVPQKNREQTPNKIKNPVRRAAPLCSNSKIRVLGSCSWVAGCSWSHAGNQLLAANGKKCIQLYQRGKKYRIYLSWKFTLLESAYLHALYFPFVLYQS